MEQHEIKCEHCGEWIDSKNEVCTYCGRTLREEERKQEKESLEKRLKDSLKPQLIEINKNDNFVIKSIKRMIRSGQIVFYAIVTFLIWFTSWAIG